MNDIFVARQPIFDVGQNVVGYELLYRADSSSTGASGANEDTMSSSVIVGGVLGLGLSNLTEGQIAFINLSEEMILDGAAELLDPERVVIELLETVRPTEQVIDACKGLVHKGFRLALDDFVYDDAFTPLLELAEIVKVDVIEIGPQMETTIKSLEPFGVTLLAEKVEDKEMHAQCVDQGFELFQGFHYFRPETLTKKDLSSQSVTVVRLMNLLQDPNVTDRTIEEAFKSDPGLTYKLLRIVNSAALGGRGVQSISHAMALLGRDPLYRWLCLMLMSRGSGDGEIQTEVIKAALLRGRMYEAVGDVVRNSRNRDVPSGGSLFLVGLFSEIEMLVGVPVEQVLSDVDVTEAVRAAILQHEGTAGTILSAVEGYMDADWDRAEGDIARLGADSSALFDVYLDSITWAGDRMAFHQQAA